MRIIAGTKKGLKLFSPPSAVSRPITDRVKESLFSILYKYGLPEGKIVADVFSGVGSLGLESLSRDASFVTFVEQSPQIAATLKKNIQKADFTASSKVLIADAFKIAAPIDPDRPKYDLVFIDPPFVATKEFALRQRFDKLMSVLSERLAPDAIVVVRTHSNSIPFTDYPALKIIDRRSWGINAVTIFRSSQND